ncbi:MAG: carbohydrate porin [Burkholderiales bacterium]
MPTSRSLARIGCIATAFALSALWTAQAAPPPISITAGPSDGSVPQPAGFWGFMDGVQHSSNLLGNLWGLRTDLSRAGMTLSIQETSEDLGNTSGGVRKGFEYDGLTQAVLQLNTQRAFGWYGGLFNASVLQIHGQNLSADNLQTLQTASGIEADRGFRLWELWYDQKFLDEDRLDVKIGQQSVDQEFIVSNNALVFVNTMFGWPMLPSADMPGGGPAYPLSAIGTRISARPVDSVKILAGVFNGSPVRNNAGDPQQNDPRGTSFPLGNGTLDMIEVQFSYPALGSMVEPDASPPLGWTYRIGAWYDSQMFADRRLDQNGLSLANPGGNGVPAQRHGNYSFYVVGDHLIWRDPNELNRTLSLFARIMTTPLTDRNLIDSSLNAGMVLHCPFAYRTDDTFGVGVSVAHVSSHVAGLERDTVYYSAAAMPVQSGESVVEATYQYQVKPWLQLQPDVQYVFNPGGGIPNPNAPGQSIKNELVLGLRTNIAF